MPRVASGRLGPALLSDSTSQRWTRVPARGTHRPRFHGHASPAAFVLPGRPWPRGGRRGRRRAGGCVCRDRSGAREGHLPASLARSLRAARPPRRERMAGHGRAPLRCRRGRRQRPAGGERRQLHHLGLDHLPGPAVPERRARPLHARPRRAARGRHQRVRGRGGRLQW